MNVFCLGAEQTDSLWPLYSHHLYRLERDGYCEADEIRADLKDAEKQLWGAQGADGAITGVVVTRITNRTCEIVGACGSATADDIRVVHAEIERWAKSIGCSRMRLQGRKGWLRILNGYSQTGIVAEKEL